MELVKHVSFYEEISIEHDVSSFIAHGVTITDFAVTPGGYYLLGLSDGSLLVGQRESNVIEWVLVEVFTTTLQKILVGPTHIFIIGIDEGVQFRSRFGGVFSVQSSGPTHSGFVLAILSYSRGRRRQSSAAEATLVLQQKIPSSLSMAVTGMVVTAMSVTEDEHYLVLGTNKGQLEVIRLNRNKSILLTEVTATSMRTTGSKTDARIPIQSIFVVPSTEGTRLAWIFGSSLTTPSSVADPNSVLSYMGLYAFNSYGSHLHSLARLVSPQPTYQTAVLCDYNSSSPASSLKGAYGTITYFNYTQSLNIVEILTPCSLSKLVLNNPNDIAKIDTVIRAPHPLLYSSRSVPLVSLQRNSINHLMTLDLSGVLEIYDDKRLIYKASIPQLEYRIVVSPITCSFIYLSTSPSHNFCIKEVRLLSDHARVKSLISNNLYMEALTMAKQSNCSLTSLDIATIHMQFAEFLFEQGQLEQSIDEYSQTSKLLEPCVVLSKFLNKNRVDLMVRYILSISRAGKADETYIRMLFNCYEKLGQHNAIHEFIEEAIQVYQSTNGQQYVIRNIKGAYDALRDMGLIDEALLLAICLGEGLLAINLLLDNNRYTEIFCLLSIMDPDDCRMALIEFGHELIKHSPQDICKIIKRLCVMFSSEQLSNLPMRYRQAVFRETNIEPDTIPMWITRISKWNRASVTTEQVFSITDFIFIFSDTSLNNVFFEILRSIFVRTLDKTLTYDSFTPTIAVVFFELQLCLKMNEAEILQNLKDYIGLINYTLENVGTVSTSRLKSPVTPLNPPSVKAGTKSTNKDKPSKKLKKLKAEIRDGLARILVCFYLHDFKAGILRLLQMNLDHVNCIRFYISTGDLYSAGEAYLRMLEDQDFMSEATFEKDLWIQLLTACIVTNNTEVVRDTLRIILEQEEIPPEQVLQIIFAALSQTPEDKQSSSVGEYYFEPDDIVGHEPLKMGAGLAFAPFCDYFLKANGRVLTSLCSCVKSILESRAQLRDAEKLIARFSGVQHWTKGVCSRCNLRLEPPIVYFGCGHAFHSNCLREHKGCNHCYPSDAHGTYPVAKAASGRAQTFAGLVEELFCPEVARFFPQ